MAVQNLWLQCQTQQEIASAVGMPQKSVDDLIARICKYEIPLIPNQFAENPPEDSATEKVKQEWETARQGRILEANRNNAEHATDFAVPVYNVWKQQEKPVSHTPNYR